MERAVPAGKVIHAIADNYATHNFQQIATVNAGNGLSADGHEFLITPWDTAPILAYTTATAKLSSIGGPANQTIINGVVQEIDISTGKVLFQWNSEDHVPFSQSEQPDTVKSIEAARYRFAASMADLERCYDEQASRLRAAFVAEVAALYQSEAA